MKFLAVLPLLAAAAMAAPAPGLLAAHPVGLTSVVHQVQVPVTKTVHYGVQNVVTGYSTSILKPAIAQPALIGHPGLVTPVVSAPAPAVVAADAPVVENTIVQGAPLLNFPFQNNPQYPGFPAFPAIPTQAPPAGSGDNSNNNNQNQNQNQNQGQGQGQGNDNQGQFPGGSQNPINQIPGAQGQQPQNPFPTVPGVPAFPTATPAPSTTAAPAAGNVPNDEEQQSSTPAATTQNPIPTLPTFPGFPAPPAFPNYPQQPQIFGLNQGFFLNPVKVEAAPVQQAPAPAPVQVEAAPAPVQVPVADQVADDDTEIVDARSAGPAPAPAQVQVRAQAPVQVQAPVQIAQQVVAGPTFLSAAAPALLAAPQLQRLQIHQDAPANLVSQEKVLAPVRTHTQVTPQFTQVVPEVTVRKVVHDVPVATPVVAAPIVHHQVAAPQFLNAGFAGIHNFHGLNGVRFV